MSIEDPWQNARNILCIRLDSIGDVLMTTPAIRALKEDQLERRITLLTSKAGAKIAPLIPEVDDVIVYDPPWMKATPTPLDNKTEFKMIGYLNRRQFDAAVIFTTFSQSPLPAALLTFLAGIPLRLAHCRENPYHLLTHWVPETDHVGQPHIRHEVRRQLDLTAAVGSKTTNEHLSLRVADEVIENVRTILSQTGVDVEKPWIALHPGATASSRRYPPEGFAEVAQKLTSNYGLQVVFTGTAPEIGLIESIRSKVQAGTFSLVDRLDIQQFSALLSQATLLISNNTGPVHIAAALNTPVVDIYALTNSQHTPWKVAHRTLYHDVPCKFCYKSICPMGHHNCLRLVQPDEVIKAALELLAWEKPTRVNFPSLSIL